MLLCGDDDESKRYEHSPYSVRFPTSSSKWIHSQKKKKTAEVKSKNTGSLRGLRKAMGLNGRFVGLMRDLTVKFAKVSSANMTKAQTRIAQANPSCGMR